LVVQVGSEEIGDAFTKGIETEFNLPFREARRASPRSASAVRPLRLWLA